MGLKEIIFGGSVKGVDLTPGAFAGSIQEWLPVKNIIGGVVVTKDRRFVNKLFVDVDSAAGLDTRF